MNRRFHIDMQVELPRKRAETNATQKVDEAENMDDAGVRTAKSPVKTFGSSDLFNGSREVAIEHGGALYRLKITRQGKLILNK